MKYVIKVVDTNPEGGICGTMYYLADTERDMERVINAFTERSPYTTVTCLGPIFQFPTWMKEIINNHT